MRYPTISRETCSELADRKIMNPESSFDDVLNDKTIIVGEGVDVDLSLIEGAAQAVMNEIPIERRVNELDKVEGRAASHLYAALENVPIEVLDDRGFWRFLSFAYFWDFIEWREHNPFLKGNYMKYLDGEDSTESVLTRMYLRVAAIGGSEYAELASAVERGVDVWRSHILRVRTGTSPALTRALVRFQERNQLKRDDMRELAKRLNRTWTNVVLNIYNDSEAEALIAELSSDLVGND